MSLRTLIFGEDKNQAIRIGRFLVSMVAYALSFLLTCISYSLGYLEGWVIVFCAIVVPLKFGIFYFWMRSGLNLRMTDPSLTLPQMLVATLVIMFLMYNATHVRGPFLIIYLIVYLFGVFALNTRQFLKLTVFVMFTYAAVIYMLRNYHPERISVSEDMLQWMALAALLPFFAVLGGHISELRLKLRNSHTELEKAMDVIHEMAIRDDLTGIYNRRHFIEMLTTEKFRADRNGQLFCLIMLDIDHFKKVNDSLGHLVGDQVLRTSAMAMSNVLRSFDFCGRYGGEEFILVVGQSTGEGAMLCAERIRSSIEELRFPDLPHDFRVTISLGVTEYRLREELSATIARADEALYRAKEAGRNRIAYS